MRKVLPALLALALLAGCSTIHASAKGQRVEDLYGEIGTEGYASFGIKLYGARISVYRSRSGSATVRVSY